MELRAPGHTAIDSVIQNAKRLLRASVFNLGFPGRESIEEAFLAKAQRTGTERYQVAMVTNSLCGLRQTTWPL